MDATGFIPLEQLIQNEERDEHPELVGRYDRVPDMATAHLHEGDFLLTVINIGRSRADDYGLEVRALRVTFEEDIKMTADPGR